LQEKKNHDSQKSSQLLKKRLVGMKKIKIKNLQETNKMQMLARKREGTCIAIVKTKLGLWL
jgi:hypothetical protein